jgi:hypothetical protein
MHSCTCNPLLSIAADAVVMLAQAATIGDYAALVNPTAYGSVSPV